MYLVAGQRFSFNFNAFHVKQVTAVTFPLTISYTLYTTRMFQDLLIFYLFNGVLSSRTFVLYVQWHKLMQTYPYSLQLANIFGLFTHIRCGPPLHSFFKAVPVLHQRVPADTEIGIQQH